ncbi:hypothetical protein A3H16_00500 [Candidatus Kaiserbacteria bacterium RIFCSPLOWO2_12_FULL_53_8]|uniref:Uncharacterized protein n=2 Tax=Candidatus Kaiseribacteriota TaxID=1752734 RepID=A0A1F6CXL8_9BACT|nr:MAG: hypothetical protein A2851_03360 [Candidatus Kaiserbacteria bacterium RIFCSPHIGHO2_01_FULL_53_29]OGG92124.1 MAG: hypothetical protein A3H16_00500 [Candidatus Kaiserbacteria bacterium RIFCSPLOWO2_12_FULL_53_8]
MTHISLKKLLVILAALVAIASLAWAFGVFEPQQSMLASDSETQEILDRVVALPEVQEFIRTLRAAGKVAQFNVEDQGDTWAVQVFEIVTEGANSHTATFDWYEVDKATGAISSMTE